MKRAAVALSDLLVTIARAVGLEGLFLTVGTVLIAVGSSYISAAGPWFTVGAVSVLVSIALAVPRRSRE